ncbi:hypothetical protein L596_023952 [Steinernema carpocapsae]|uniref:Chromo domain-containing protein n=1 Tax=Steinernema carpocapsae TaxID=34508 RepID=A0A4U5MF78_STECR|nr:hypothetical protein L596_023952 [Steinernema carpocapsae]
MSLRRRSARLAAGNKVLQLHNSWEPRDNILDERLLDEYEEKKKMDKKGATETRKRTSTSSVASPPKKSPKATPPMKRPRRSARADTEETVEVLFS